MTRMRAWSDPMEAPKSTSAPKNVPCMAAAILLQARLMVLLCAPPSPMRVGNLGLLRREKVCVAIHSSSLCAPADVAQPVGDQEVECKLKSPMTKVGIVASMLRFAKRCPTWTKVMWMQPLMTQLWSSDTRYSNTRSLRYVRRRKSTSTNMDR
jgi:hypothetical protein